MEAGANVRTRYGGFVDVPDTTEDRFICMILPDLLPAPNQPAITRCWAIEAHPYSICDRVFTFCADWRWPSVENLDIACIRKGYR